MDNVRLQVLFSQSLSDQLLDEFKLVVQSKGYDDYEKLLRMEMDSIEPDGIVVRVPLEGSRSKIMRLSWQRHLANLAVTNVYNHS